MATHNTLCYADCSAIDGNHAKGQAMILLTRKEKQSIVIGDDIVITVCQINGNQIKIGIDAPGETPILREELWLEAPCESDEQV